MSTILITGVNRGIGLQALQHYADLGWRVIGTCRDPESAAEASALAGRDNVSLHALEVTDTAAVDALAAQLAGTAIDVLLLNAGMMGKASMKLGELDAADFLRVMEVNVVALAMCVQAFSSHVAASERGVIVGMGSFLGSMACNTDGGGYSYRASKAGVHAIMRSVSFDLKDQGVLAIAMHPGWVQTEMGGPNATISTEESVRGMASVIENLGPEDSGRLLTYSGEELPW